MIQQLITNIYGLYLIDKRDYDEAIEYLKKSAQRDFACSNIVLGNLYEYGEYEVDKNIKKQFTIIQNYALQEIMFFVIKYIT